MKKITLLILALLCLTGCGSLRYISDEEQAADKARREGVANAAATIWEASDAIEKGAPVQQVSGVIKANSASIIHSQGYTYSPAQVTQDKE